MRIPTEDKKSSRVVDKRRGLGASSDFTDFRGDLRWSIDDLRGWIHALSVTIWAPCINVVWECGDQRVVATASNFVHTYIQKRIYDLGLQRFGGRRLTQLSVFVVSHTVNQFLRCYENGMARATGHLLYYDIERANLRFTEEPDFLTQAQLSVRVAAPHYNLCVLFYFVWWLENLVALCFV